MADLVADLKRLRLYGMAACYAECVEQGSSQGLTTYESLLTHLLRAETTDRAMRSTRYQMHAARFPIHRDLAGFDFDQSKVDRKQISTFPLQRQDGARVPEMDGDLRAAHQREIARARRPLP